MTTGWTALAFRPPTVLKRLRRGSRACPLALRDVAGGLVSEDAVIPVVLAPSVAVARAALLAAKAAGSVLGLEAPAGEPPERWFDAVTAVADELAPGLPLLLGATVVLQPGGVAAARALRLAHRLVEAGITHLVLDVDALEPDRRADEVARAAEPALERGLGVECLLPGPAAGLPGVDGALSLLSELASLGASPELAGVRCPVPRDEVEAAGQARALEALADASAGAAICRRGSGAGRLLRRVRRGALRACDDGAAVAAQAALEPDPERAEARAYGEVGALVDATRSAGSARTLSAALERAREG